MPTEKQVQSKHGFLALALRQRLINRWSLMQCQQRESVLEHSAVVAMLALLVGEIAKSIGNEVDMATMMGHALLHDATEVLTGDVVTPVKKATESLAAEFARLERGAEHKLMNTLPKQLQEPIAKYFHPGGYEQRLVKGCDVYAAYLKCKLEIAGGNVVEFQDALDTITETLNGIKNELVEIRILDESFGESIGLSVDKLLTNGSIQPAKSMDELLELWRELGDTPVSDCGQYLDGTFQHFDSGDDVHSVWHWFENQNPEFCVANAMYTNPQKAES